MDETHLEDVNFSLDFGSSLDGIDVAAFDELDSAFFSPPLRMQAKFDFAKFAFSQRLEQEIRSKHDASAFWNRMRRVRELERWLVRM